MSVYIYVSEGAAPAVKFSLENIVLSLEMFNL